MTCPSKFMLARCAVALALLSLPGSGCAHKDGTSVEATTKARDPSLSGRAFAAPPPPEETEAVLLARLEGYEARLDALAMSGGNDVQARDAASKPDAATLETEVIAVEARGAKRARRSRSAPPKKARRSGARAPEAPTEDLSDDLEFAPRAPSREDAPASAPSADEVEEDAPAEDAGRCGEICELRVAICGLETRICELAEAHREDGSYAALCERAGEDCQRATTACNACGG